MRRRRIVLLVGGVAALVLVGLVVTVGVPYCYPAAIRSGKASIPYVRQFDRLYPNADHYISYFTGTYGRTKWNSEAVLYGRYVLTMQMDVTLNRLRNRITSYGKPMFVLEEVQAASPTATTNAGGVEFGQGEWKKLVDSGGDLRVVGVTPKKNQPISGLNQLPPGNR